MADFSTISGRIPAFGQLLAALAVCCALSLSCSPRNSAADATGVADVDSDVGAEVAGDGLDSVEVSPVEVEDGQGADVGDAGGTEVSDGTDVGDAIKDEGDAITDSIDAITDSIGDGGDVDLDLGLSEVGPPEDATAVDGGVPCTSTDIPAALTGTVEFEAAAYISNPVVMGCGKGPPKPVKTGTPCCDCPPPYSCYCNGECGWLRAPDLVKPQHDGQAVWTGKWVVSVGEVYGLNDPGPKLLHVQKWQPGTGKGFKLVPLPPKWFKDGYPKLFLWGKVVVIAAAHALNSVWATEYSPVQPIFLYDPETDAFSEIAMPTCGKLLLSGGTLACVAAWQGGPPLHPGGLQVYIAGSGTWALVQPPGSLVGKNWAITAPDRAVADEMAVYFVGAIGSSGPWPDGTPGWPSPGHVLKYAFSTQQWSDIGLVPEEWQVGTTVIDHFGIVRVKGAVQAARFRLDSLKWEVGPKFSYVQLGDQEPTLTPCGVLFGSGTKNLMGGGTSYRPVLLAADLSWKLLSPWGYPDDAVTSRNGGNFLTTDKEILALGGMDGPPEGNFVYHQDSYRYPLSALCNNGGSK